MYKKAQNVQAQAFDMFSEHHDSIMKSSMARWRTATYEFAVSVLDHINVTISTIKMLSRNASHSLWQCCKWVTDSKIHCSLFNMWNLLCTDLSLPQMFCKDMKHTCWQKFPFLLQLPYAKCCMCIWALQPMFHMCYIYDSSWCAQWVSTASFHPALMALPISEQFHMTK